MCTLLDHIAGGVAESRGRVETSRLLHGVWQGDFPLWMPRLGQVVVISREVRGDCARSTSLSCGLGILHEIREENSDMLTQICVIPGWWKEVLLCSQDTPQQSLGPGSRLTDIKYSFYLKTECCQLILSRSLNCDCQWHLPFSVKNCTDSFIWNTSPESPLWYQPWLPTGS